jgi:hypothetical protein
MNRFSIRRCEMRNLRKHYGTWFVIVFFSISFLISDLWAYKKPGEQQRMWDRDTIAINQIKTYITNYGEFGMSPAHTSGCWWPKATNNWYIFGAGIWIAGIRNGVDSVVVNGYNTVGSGEECIPGPKEFNNEHIQNPSSHPEIRLFVSTDSLDYAEWPYLDSLGNKVIIGDQDTWCYFNSHRDSSQTEPPYISLPLTITRHTYAWNNDLFENMLFFEYIIENTDPTGTDTIRNMYVGIGSDLDVGNSDDDLVGFTRITDLGYAYTPNQEPAWNTSPPYYVGMAHLQGPVADDTVKVGGDTLNPDTLILPGERIPITAFRMFTRDVDANDDHERYLAMAGYDFTETPPLYVPFRDSIDTIPTDKRMVLSSGPFFQAPGDADTVAFALVFSNGSTLGLQYLRQEAKAAREFFRAIRFR